MHKTIDSPNCMWCYNSHLVAGSLLSVSQRVWSGLAWQSWCGSAGLCPLVGQVSVQSTRKDSNHTYLTRILSSSPLMAMLQKGRSTNWPVSECSNLWDILISGTQMSGLNGSVASTSHVLYTVSTCTAALRGGRCRWCVCLHSPREGDYTTVHMIKKFDSLFKVRS